MNPLAFLILVLGALLIIAGIKGSYHNIGAALKKL